MASSRFTTPRTNATPLPGGWICVVLLLFVPAGLNVAAEDGVPPREAVARGDRALAQGRYYDAIDLYSDAQSTNPAYFEALFGLARAYYLLEEYDEALEYVRRADRYVRGNVDVAILRGRLLLAVGRLEEAATVFEGVLAREPNNLEAHLGVAELELARGRNDAAVATLEEALSLYPENRRALLSLAIIYEYRDQPDVSQIYLEQAIRFHRTDPAVHVLAAQHYLDTGSIGEAQAHAMTALSLASDTPEAMLILARTYLAEGKPEEALSVVEQVLAHDAQNAGAFYLAGLAFADAGDSGRAIESMQRALRLDSEEEIIRLVMEALLIDEYSIEHESRRELAKYHAQRGRELVDANRLSQAVVAFRRSLLLYPFAADARRRLAEVYRTQGFDARYLRELTVLRDIGTADEEVTDLIEVYRSVLADGVAADWGIEQFEAARDRYRLALFVEEPSAGLDVPRASIPLARYMRFMLHGYENIEVAGEISTIARMSDAFSPAREADADYFIVLAFERGERSFALSAQAFLARTGTLLAAFGSNTAGNDMVSDAFYRVARDIAESLPFRANLIDRNGNRGLISAGRVDGVEEGDSYVVLAETAVLLAPRTFRLDYPGREILGQFVVTRVDDLVSEGDLERTGLFDMINTGDLVVIAPEKDEETETPSPAVLYPPLYNRIRQLRN